MKISAPASVANAFWTAIANLIDAQSTAGKAKVYSGAMPANGGALGSGNVLVMEFQLAKPCAASITNGIMTFASLGFAMAVSTEEHRFVRFEDGNGNWAMDVDSGVINTPLADGTLPVMRFSAASYSIGSTIAVTSAALHF